MRDVIVVCRRPGMIRAGVRHPAVAAHAPFTFTGEQLHELIEEPEITVVVGEVLTAVGVGELARDGVAKKSKKPA